VRSYLVCERKLFHPGPTVVIRAQSAAWLVWISAQETKDRAPQFRGISLQVIKEINAKLIWIDVAFPSRDNGTRVRTQEHSSAEQIPMDFVDVGRVKRPNLAIVHFHGQMRPHSLNRIAHQKDYL